MWEKILLAGGLTLAIGVFANRTHPAPKILIREVEPQSQIVYASKILSTGNPRDWDIISMVGVGNLGISWQI